MTIKERWQFILLWCSLGLLPLGLRPLWEPDEARYAEIPREMLATGDWLTPHLNGVLYFEKPPLQYWLSAVCLRLFGSHDLVARLPLALASLLALGCAYVLARRLGARHPIWAAFMVATALLGFVCHQILTLDALFSAFLVLALTFGIEAVWARVEGRPHLGRLLGAFAALAAAMLTKGLAAPVLLGGTLGLSLAFAWRNPALRRAVLAVGFHPAGWGLFLALAAPWFVLVERANPGHAQFFFIHEHFARFSSHVHARQGHANPLLDKFYFLAVLAVGLLPWLSASFRGLWRGSRFAARSTGPQSPETPLRRWTSGALLCAAAWPLVFFSLSGSKLPPYILPVLVPLAVLAVTFEDPEDAWGPFRRQGWELVALGILLAAAPLLAARTTGALPWTLGLGLAFCGLGAWGLRPKALSAERWMVALGAAMLLVTLAAQALAGPGKSVKSLVAQAPPEARWISFGNLYQGVAYYAKTRMVVVAGTGELAFGRDQLPAEARAAWFFEGPDQLGDAARRLRDLPPARPVWALADRRAWRDLTDAAQAPWEVMDRSPSTLLLRLKDVPQAPS